MSQTENLGERIVLNASAAEDDAGLHQQYADAVLAVMAQAQGLGRAEVSERVKEALGLIGRHAHTVEVAEVTDKILRGVETGLTIQTDDGVVLGYGEGERAARP